VDAGDRPDARTKANIYRVTVRSGLRVHVANIRAYRCTSRTLRAAIYRACVSSSNLEASTARHDIMTRRPRARAMAGPVAPYSPLI
jgi:hypothetical protein